MILFVAISIIIIKKIYVDNIVSDIKNDSFDQKQEGPD